MTLPSRAIRGQSRAISLYGDYALNMPTPLSPIKNAFYESQSLRRNVFALSAHYIVIADPGCMGQSVHIIPALIVHLKIFHYGAAKAGPDHGADIAP